MTISTFGSAVGKTAFELAYEISPIILVGGIAIPIGGYLPITVITEALDIAGFENNEFFAHFKPLAGSTLLDYQVAEYPFANFQVAANAVIQQPLKISMMMVCPAQNGGGYTLKQAQLSLLQNTLQKHIQLAGTFTIITPAFTYTNCLLTGLRDITNTSDKQAQFMYQFDFVQPLISSISIQSLGTLMSSAANGVASAFTSW